MRLARFWLLGLLALAACDLPRPEGTFVEMDASLGVDASSAANMTRSDAAVATAPPIPGGAPAGAQGGAQGGTLDGGTPGGIDGADGGSVGGGTLDAGTPLSPEEMALKKLEGRYLMRMDMYSTASATASLITINTSNRVSHLYATQLFVENGQLKGYEQLCHQTFAHKCTKGCSTLSTTMSPAMTDWFVTKVKPITREYVLSNGLLEGRVNTAILGYDGMTDAKIATSVDDARVWDSVPNTGKREGLLLAIDLVVPLKNVRCDVYTTQIFTSKILATKLPGAADAPSLPTSLKFGLNTGGSDGTTLDTSSPDCSANNGPAPTAGEQYVRYAAVGLTDFLAPDKVTDLFWNCPPAEAWDQRLPAVAP